MHPYQVRALPRLRLRDQTNALIGAAANRPDRSANRATIGDAPIGIRTADRPEITVDIIIIADAISPGRFRGGEFFEAMMNFAASAAGSRERWWREWLTPRAMRERTIVANSPPAPKSFLL